MIGPSPPKALLRPTPVATPSSSLNKRKHSNLILVLGICGGILIVAAVTAVFIICSCAHHDGKAKGSPVETGMFSKHYVHTLFAADLGFFL